MGAPWGMTNYNVHVLIRVLGFKSYWGLDSRAFAKNVEGNLRRGGAKTTQSGSRLWVPKQLLNLATWGHCTKL